ncbi:MAG TPA: 3-deoxy-7-phosphoheptulonate synthase [Acidimicrobiales bacterium]
MTPKNPVRDRRIERTRPLLSPEELRRQTPLTRTGEDVVVQSREGVAGILDGLDDRLLVVVGPCSVHDPAAALDYAHRLAELAALLGDDLLVVMRVYFEKPRTTVGWKGLINDPDLDDGFQVDKGLHAARSLLVEIVGSGLPVGCEFLDPIIPQYLSDAVSWGAIGARTAESQIHRQLASGLSMPVGIKNSTAGDVQVAVDAISAAAHSQVFIGIGDDGRAAILTTAGNPDGHVVLRGSGSGPNCDPAGVSAALERLEAAALSPRVVIDASHGNSAKDPVRQLALVADLATRIGHGEPGIVGVMLESFLVAGRQELRLGHQSTLTYGQSVTDACIGWDDTVDALHRLATAVSARREVTGRSLAGGVATRAVAG